MCSIVVTTRPQGDGHTDWFALSVMVGTAGCTGNPLSGMKPASDLSSHKGTDASVVTAKETKHGITLHTSYICYSTLRHCTTQLSCTCMLIKVTPKSFKIVTMMLQ